MTMKQRATLTLILTVLVLASVFGQAQETATLTAPETTPNNTVYRRESLEIVPDDVATAGDEGRIFIVLRGSNNEMRRCAYTHATNPTATFLITALNKANLSTAYAGNATTGSLLQRIFHRLFVMGEGAAVCTPSVGAGTVTGSVP
jgi:hypothetical protein